jgi:hypothetical protein
MRVNESKLNGMKNKILTLFAIWFINLISWIYPKIVGPTKTYIGKVFKKMLLKNGYSFLLCKVQTLKNREFLKPIYF